LAGVRAVHDAKSCKRRKCVLGLKAPDTVDRAAFDAKKAEIADKFDALTELEEEASLRLQMAMEQKSALETALSNAMKALSETASTTTKNIK
jgi:hypothetical protein